MKQKLANSAIVVVTARNVEKWVARCIRSILEQTYQDLGIVFIDDCSGDSTYKTALGLLADNPDAIVAAPSSRCYAMKNYNFAIRECCSSSESVIFIVDGDDWLACPTAIEEMMGQYQTADVVWSKHQSTDGKPCCCGPIKGDDIRNHPWVTSHLRSFRKFLYDAIHPKDLLDKDGLPYKMNCDQAMMLPVLEQVPAERRRFYDKVLYVYNRDNPLNDDKVDTHEGWRMSWRIRSQTPYGIHDRYLAESPDRFQVKEPIERRQSVSVIVSSYNQLPALKLVLESFGSQSDPPLEVIVADDGSSDGTIEWLDSLADRHPFLLRYVTRKHDGYRLASLQNLGAKQAKGQRLLFTNADVIHCPTSVLGHAKLAANIVGAGVVKSISEEGASKVTPESILDFSRLLTLAANYLHGRTNIVNGKYDLNLNPVAVWGGNFSVPASAFATLGGFDEGYDVGWGGEDASLAKRCQTKAGCSIAWVDQSEAYHLAHPCRTYSLRQRGSARYRATFG